MSGFLADLDLASVSEDPNSFPDAGYNGYLTGVKMVDHERKVKEGPFAGQKFPYRSVVFTYKISDGPHAGKTIDEFKCACKMPQRTDAENDKDLSWTRVRLTALGVPESRLSTVNPEDLVGTAVYFKTKTNNGYTNVTEAKVRQEGASAGVSSQSFTEAAPVASSSVGVSASDL